MSPLTIAYFCRPASRTVAVIAMLVLGSSSTVLAQDAYRLMRNRLPGVTASAVAWGDADGDGRLDVALSGMKADSVKETQIFRSVADVIVVEDDQFVHVTVHEPMATISPAVSHGALAWNDYDSDGDLDLVVLGSTTTGAAITRIYRNEDGGQFLQASIPLQGLYSGAAAWGDYDTDGDADLLLCGIDETGAYRTILYENLRIAFAARSTNLPTVAHCDLAWADYDDDGDLDLLLTGLLPSNVPTTQLFRNDSGGVFSDAGLQLPGLFFAAVALGDVDDDGDPDVLVSGGRLSPFIFDGVSAIYRNEGDSFVPISNGLQGAYFGGLASGDFDNDGDLDVVLSGATNPYLAASTDPTGSRFGGFYENADGNFVPAQLPGKGLFIFGGGMKGDVRWGDYDDDGDLDMLVVGQRGSGGGNQPFLDIYRNEMNVSGYPANTPPSAPSDPRAEVSGNSVLLSWDAASDAQTPSAGLSYNVRIGTSPGDTEVVPPMSIPASGRRLLPETGNAGQGTSWRVLDLSPGRYFWAVQALDHAYKGSVFSDEQTFTVD